MATEQRIDDLIEAGWKVLESNFDLVAFQQWRRRALDCLTVVVGTNHVYTKHFVNLVQQQGASDLLIATGILSAAKEQASCEAPNCSKPMKLLTSSHANFPHKTRRIS